MNFCEKCLKIITLQPVKTTGGKCECINVECKCKKPFLNYGWICPVCGRGLSPYSNTCPCKNNYVITYTNTR